MKTIKIESAQQVSQLDFRLPSKTLSIASILNLFSDVRYLWQEEGEYYQKAKNKVRKEDLESLKFIEQLCKRESLEQRLKSDFRKKEALDEFVTQEDYLAKIYYAPVGNLLHITAGNIFLGAIDSMIMGLLTKNKNWVKLSSHCYDVPLLFFESLLAVDHKNFIRDHLKLIQWEGRDELIQKNLVQKMNAVMVWGGEEAIESYRSSCLKQTRFIEHGPKISFYVITEEGLKKQDNIFDKIALDICLWDQSACASPQNIFLERSINKKEFITQLAQALAKSPYKRKPLSPDEAVEFLKDYYEALYYEFENDIPLRQGEDYQVLPDHKILTPSALNRSIKIKEFTSAEDISQMLTHFSFYLQTCGLISSIKQRPLYARELAKSGVKRITAPGEMLKGKDGSSHDGRLSLLELTHVCVDESADRINEFLEKIDVTFYQNKKRESLEDYPLINGDLLGQHSLITDQAFLSPQAKSGYIYSSGGSTGGAKFCFYSYPEFKNTCDLLAKSYQGLGLNSSDKVGNLFMAANMWSSFNAIQEALEICQTVQFPMGGQVSVKDFEFYIKSFDIKILFGVPSLLFSLARETAGLKIEKIFYAGEIMNDKYKEVFEKNWGCREFYSAGYASVDVGPIGYQTKDCKKNEHYLFEGIILEVINEEAVITSTLRKMMPVIRYQTGDRVKIISQDDKGTKFKLLGRVDRLLFIWGARIELRHFEQALKHQGIGEDLFQIDLDINKGKETLILRSKEYIEKEKFITSLLEYSDDLARTQKMSFLEDHIKVFMEDLIIHPKTAKMCQLRDFR